MNKSVSETKRLNEELEQRHYEFVSNCNDGKGDPAACHSYGEWLAVVDKNYIKAAEFYGKNCHERKYAPSCFNLGRLHFAGKDVEQNDRLAAELFDKSCRQGHLEGCNHLGILYLNGVGVKKDLKKALECLHKACDAGESRSCNRLGSIYLKSHHDIPHDAMKAKACLEKACNSNFAPACHNLAVMYKNGDEGVAKDQDKFEEYSRKTKDLVEQAGALSGIQIA